ncbi:MAG: GNAT family N-acetyltransferase [Candidatus Staskawiczbacteria bacterium]|jgi:ribosomal protein S18 acetylase RimI-like enzyme
MEKVEIVEYTDEFKEQIKDLITCIYDDERGNERRVRPDLEIIKERYQGNNGNFWVAINEGKVVGTIGLINQGNKRASMHRFCVAKIFRGKEKGVSSELYSTFLEFAKNQGYKKIFLGTGSEATAAIKFYERNGFIKIESLPEDIANHPQLINDKIFYELDL